MRLKDAVVVAVALLGAVGSQGCATGSKVPSLHEDDLPRVQFKALNPRDILIQVKNNREVNRKAGNTADVERAISEVVGKVMTRGGLALKPNSQNLLSLLVEDYTGTEMEGACVRLTGKLKARWGSTLSQSIDACYSMTRGDGFPMAGEISDTYTLALKQVLEQLEKHQMELLRGGRG